MYTLDHALYCMMSMWAVERSRVCLCSRLLLSRWHYNHIVRDYLEIYNVGASTHSFHPSLPKVRKEPKVPHNRDMLLQLQYNAEKEQSYTAQGGYVKVESAYLHLCGEQIGGFHVVSSRHHCFDALKS